MTRTTFQHGVHPPELKDLTAAVATRRMPFPDQVVLPLRQHTGKPAIPLVKAGDRVERGDLLAKADGFISAPVHASATGTVAAIEYWPHPMGAAELAIRIDVERFSGQLPRPRMVPDWRDLSPEQIVQAVQDAGVVGLGGAAFPTHVKLIPPKDATIDTLIVNGCECEPYLTTDHRVMVEQPERVHEGIRIAMRCLGIAKVIVGIERNKPDAIAAMERTKPSDIDVTILPLTVKYPQGAEKMLIEVVTGRAVPSGKLPSSVGVLVQNVASLAAVAEVFDTGLPLIERIVTVTGHGIAKPSNLIIPVGVMLRDVFAFCGGLAPKAREVVFGGPMMGIAQGSLDTPITKGTTGVLVLTDDECRRPEVYPCIRCGRCLDACPVFLNPSHLGRLARVRRYEDMAAMHLSDCMLCGCCSYVCPSNIPLAQMFQLSKMMLRKQATTAAPAPPVVADGAPAADVDAPAPKEAIAV